MFCYTTLGVASQCRNLPVFELFTRRLSSVAI
nr:hypothetical protein OBXNPYZZ_OBXNPYZZ_CDS_0003 [Microvirus sp.]